MSAVEFQPFPKIARLNREIVVTEKIDGTNAAVVIKLIPFGAFDFDPNALSVEYAYQDEDGQEFEYVVYAQSRTRFITTNSDNYGFAGWVYRNAEALTEALGAGTHYGEWWGSGVQRKYGLSGGEKYFSLFNSARWGLEDLSAVPGLGSVPVLYQGDFSEAAIDLSIELLRTQGSIAAPGFDRPEGVVVFHTASRDMFKITLEGDEKPKGQIAHERDEEFAV